MARKAVRAKFAVFFAVAAAFATLSATRAWAGSGNFEGSDDHDRDLLHFFGYTRGEDGKPVSGVSITISIASGDVSEMSDANGLFFFDSRDLTFDPPAINFSCTKPGYEDTIGKKERYSGDKAPVMVICLMRHK